MGRGQYTIPAGEATGLCRRDFSRFSNCIGAGRFNPVASAIAIGDYHPWP